MSMIVGTIWAVGVTAINAGLVAYSVWQGSKMQRVADDLRWAGNRADDAVKRGRDEALISAVAHLRMAPGEVLVVQPDGRVTEEGREKLANDLAALGFSSGRCLILENAKLSVLTPQAHLDVLRNVSGWGR